MKNRSHRHICLCFFLSFFWVFVCVFCNIMWNCKIWSVPHANGQQETSNAAQNWCRQWTVTDLVWCQLPWSGSCQSWLCSDNWICTPNIRVVVLLFFCIVATYVRVVMNWVWKNIKADGLVVSHRWNTLIHQSSQATQLTAISCQKSGNIFLPLPCLMGPITTRKVCNVKECNVLTVTVTPNVTPKGHSAKTMWSAKYIHILEHNELY